MRTYPPPGYLGPRAIAWWALRTQVESLHVEGINRVPRAGPVLIVARHAHHLLDGAVLVERLRRPAHIVVGLDWARTAAERRIMECACRAADFPIVLRPATLGTSGGYRTDELFRYTRTALRETTRLWREGRLVVIFPEAYPNVDPVAGAGRAAGVQLPFARGTAAMMAHAGRAGLDVAVVPAGFAYERAAKWRITARFGEPLVRPDLSELEAEVRRLSLPATAISR